MKFRADEITSVIQNEIANFQAEVTRTEVGRVLEVGDGIARIHGLSGVMTGEMIRFENGVLGLAFEPTWAALWFWIENLCFLAPFALIRTVAQRRNPARLFLAGVAVMAGGTLLRLNGYLITFDTGPGWHYFPALTEVLVTAGFFAVEVLGYIVITRRFPVLPREEPAI